MQKITGHSSVIFVPKLLVAKAGSGKSLDRGNWMVLHVHLSTSYGLGWLLIAKKIYFNVPTANFTVG